MAEFALGLTKTAVEGTVSRVKSAIDEEEKLKVRVQNDLVFITGEFQMMQSFLVAANRERARNEVVRTWVRQIRDLAFDVEDCVELVVSLSLDSKSGWWWRLVPSCIAGGPLPLDVAVAEIQRLKARVEDVSHRNTRYNLISDSSSSHTKTTPATVAVVGGASTRTEAAFDILTNVWDAAGKKRGGTGDLKKLINSEGSHLEVISLYTGMEGSGFAAPHVISEAYNDTEIRQEFGMRAWVRLIHPFNPDEFLNNLLTQLYATSSHQPPPTNKVHHSVIMQETMRKHRYLVILEDVSSVVEWDVIRMYLPENNKGSRIVMATRHFELVLSCTGKPYQVSELKRFPFGPSLCAFNKKVAGRRTDTSEFSWKLRSGGVICVCGLGDRKSIFIDRLYTAISYKSRGFCNDGVVFEKHCWVDLPDHFSTEEFYKLLLLSFYSDDSEVKEIRATQEDDWLRQRCHRFLLEHRCIMVINGLRYASDWGEIKNGLPSNASKGSSFILIVNGSDYEILARHFVDEEDQVFNIEDLEDDAVLRHLMKGNQYYGIGAKEASHRGRFFSNRLHEARMWRNRYGHVMWRDLSYLSHESLKEAGVVSVWGTAGVGKVHVVRSSYYHQMLKVDPSNDLGFKKFSWVNVPRPFNLTDFCWRLLLDFHSEDREAKKNAASDMIYGHKDPAEGCRNFIHQHRCLVVINGLCSKQDWDLIGDALLLSEPARISCIVVITNEKDVAKHCADRVFEIFGGERGGQISLRPLAEECGYYGNENEREEQASHFFSNRREDAIDWSNSFKPIGRQYGMVCCLNKHLFNYRENVGLLSVRGITGVGKSSIVRSVYCKRISESSRTNVLHRRIFDIRRFASFSWVDVPNPFNLMEFCWRLLVDFYSDNLEFKETLAVGMILGTQDPIPECRKFLRNEECLVVIDGIRSTHDWNLIRDALLPKITKARIVVIANEMNVSIYGVPDECQVVIKGLEPKAASHLFRKVAWSGRQQLNPNETELSNLAIPKCGGLPKVIVAVGEFYAKERARWPEQLLLVDQMIAEQLRRTSNDFMGLVEKDPGFHCLTGLFNRIKYYFDACSDELKPCIFYISVFPIDRNIQWKRMLRRWVAEGYCRDKFGSGAEKVGEMLFQELVKLSIVQEAPSEEAGMFQVNGFFHEYIMSRPMEDNLVFALEGSCSPNMRHTGQHLTIRSRWDRDEIVFKSMDLSRVRSLTVFGEWKSFFIFGVNMRLLRVLDLEDAVGVTDGDLDQIGKVFPRLKFLSLRGCQYITRLPSSLGGMRQLQTLDIKDTSVVIIPPAIIKLDKLQYFRAGATATRKPQAEPVDADNTITSQPPAATAASAAAAAPPPPPPDGDGARTSHTSTEAASDYDENRTPAPWSSKKHGCYVLGWVSKLHSRRGGLVSSARNGVQFAAVAAEGIGKLTALNTLGVVNVTSSGKTIIIILAELKKLTQLQKLRVSGINLKNWHGLCSVISGHRHLESLSVWAEHDQDLYHLNDISEPPKTLKSLKVYGGDVHVSPAWMQQLGNLRKGHLDPLTISTQEDIDRLKYVPCLHIFRCVFIKPVQDGELRYERVPFGPELKFLVIDCSSYKLAIDFYGLVATHVEVLLVRCASTTALLNICGLRLFNRLKEVRLTGSYSNHVKQNLQEIVDERNQEIGVSRAVLKTE